MERMTLNTGKLFICGADGRQYTPVGVIADIQEFDEIDTYDPAASANMPVYKFADFSFTAEVRMKKRTMNYLVYGWMAKGPVRKRQLKKLLSRRFTFYV